MDFCIFCQIVAKTAPAYIVYEDDFCLAFLDIHPRTRGHLQLIPKKHYRWVYEIDDMGKFATTAQRLIRDIIPLLEADHVTIGAFGGEVPHAHLWIVPQYKGAEKQVAEERHSMSKENALGEVHKLLKTKIG